MGCSWEYEETMGPIGPGGNDSCFKDTTSFSRHIFPILQKRDCVSCHNTFNTQGGVNLFNYTSVREVALRGGDKSLYGIVVHPDPSVRMPPNGADPLSACEVARIKSWTEAGAPQN